MFLDSAAGETLLFPQVCFLFFFFFFQKVNLGNWVTNSQLDFKYNLAEKMDQPSFLQVVDR